MTRAWSFVLAAGVLLACHSEQPAAAVDASNRIAVSSAPRAPASETPAQSAARLLPGYRILLATRWPGAAGFDDAIAVVADHPAEPLGGEQRVLTWVRASERTAPDKKKREYQLPRVAPVGLATVDVNGDGRNEVAVFLKEGGRIADKLEIFELLPGFSQPGELGREAAALDSFVWNEASLRDRLPLTQGCPRTRSKTAHCLACSDGLRRRPPRNSARSSVRRESSCARSSSRTTKHHAVAAAVWHLLKSATRSSSARFARSSKTRSRRRS